MVFPGSQGALRRLVRAARSRSAQLDPLLVADHQVASAEPLEIKNCTCLVDHAFERSLEATAAVDQGSVEIKELTV